MSVTVCHFSDPLLPIRSLRTRVRKSCALFGESRHSAEINGTLRGGFSLASTGLPSHSKPYLHSLWVEQSMVDAICFLMALFWSQVAAVKTVVAATGPIMLDGFVAVIAELFVRLGLPAFMFGRTFLSGRIKMMYSCACKIINTRIDIVVINVVVIKLNSAIHPAWWFEMSPGVRRFGESR